MFSLLSCSLLVMGMGGTYGRATILVGYLLTERNHDVVCVVLQNTSLCGRVWPSLEMKRIPLERKVDRRYTDSPIGMPSF